MARDKVLISLELPQPPVIRRGLGPKAPLLRSGPRLTTALGAAMLAATARRNRFPPDGSNRREMNNDPRDGSWKRRTGGRVTAIADSPRSRRFQFNVAGLKEQQQEALPRFAVVS